MYKDLVEIQKDLISEVMKKTNTDYEIINAYNRDGKVETYINTDNLIVALEDLVVAYHDLEEKYEDFKQDVHDNYRQLNIHEQI